MAQAVVATDRETDMPDTPDPPTADDTTERAGRVDFPRKADGSRSTSAFGRTVVTEALRSVDPTGSAAAERETNWRSGYLRHLRRLTEAGMQDAEVARTIATDGLRAVHEGMVVTDADADRPLTTLRDAPADRDLATVVVDGQAQAATNLAVPYRGRMLTGDDLRRQLATWVDDGIVEPTVSEAIDLVLANPDWLRLEGRTVVVLGAGAEIGPLRSLLSWGATVAAVDLPRRGIWDRVLADARERAGRLLVPVDPQGLTAAGVDAGRQDLEHTDSSSSDREVARHAGIDLIGEVAATSDWVAGLDGVPVVGTYAYADGGTHVRVTVAADVVAQRVLGMRSDAALAFLATPTDAFVVPEEAVAASAAAYAERSTTAKLVGRPLRTLSGGRLLKRNYAPDMAPGLCDALVAQQGPNYALAKRIHRWRATTARAEGTAVSLNVAPSTRTRSVVKNRVLAAAYAGAHRFGIEVFDPPTTNALMAALLVHDLHTDGGPAQDLPWQQEAYAAAHGGLWRTAYAPRSALGLATVIGVGATRG